MDVFGMDVVGVKVDVPDIEVAFGMDVVVVKVDVPDIEVVD
ncbi:hypothetical protein CASFOL_042572 [Castilleja foliolosa]|uniref:Uncharacterized protein n=1 Tax=Castilleja foliolosa TaxID=1961234 RepID=A0ABD3B870_9LAMI